MSVLVISIVLDSVYLLIFYSEKYSTWICGLPFVVYVTLREIFVWPWKIVSVSVRHLFYQPMDEKIKRGLFLFLQKKTLIWRRHCLIGQSCCNMTSMQSMDWFLECSQAWRFFHLSVRLTNQKPRVFVSMINQSNLSISMYLFLFCFSFFISRSY